MTDAQTQRASTISAPAVSDSRALRVLHALGWTFIYLGVFTLGFVVHQLVITTWFAQQAQSELAIERVAQWKQTEISDVVVPSADAGNGESGTDSGEGGVGESSSPLILKVESQPELGAAFALIRIPKLERLQDGWNVVEGVGVADLRNGAGHMPGTALPGQPGNAVISGHRTTWGQPFHELNELDPGDRIEVETALGTSIYEVREIHIVAPTAFWVTEPREGAWLTLTTCHPKFSARQRYVVMAELVSGPNYDVIEAMT
jgi:sortase A